MAEATVDVPVILGGVTDASPGESGLGVSVRRAHRVSVTSNPLGCL